MAHSCPVWWIPVAVTFLKLVKLTYAVPDDYCFSRLNRSNCGMKPTLVFTYYLPGSRCESDVWKGCPTVNRFDSEFACSHYCNGRLDVRENDITDAPLKDPCKGSVNEGNCGMPPLDVYTYDERSGTCEKRKWKGCKTTDQNMFNNEVECRNLCVNANWWFDKLRNLTEKEIGDIDNIFTLTTTGTGKDAETTITEPDNIVEATATEPDNVEEATATEPDNVEEATAGNTEQASATDLDNIDKEPIQQNSTNTTMENGHRTDTDYEYPDDYLDTFEPEIEKETTTTLDVL